MSDKNIEVENFGLLTSSVESMVVLAGANAFQDDLVTLPNLNDDQIIRLKHIVSDPKHPWMLEHVSRCNVLEKEIHQNLRKKTERKMHLEKLIIAKRWSFLSLKRKLQLFFFKTLITTTAFLAAILVLWAVFLSQF